ncbi:hypothetical protein AMJ50_00865 [Parcubacteria bacterium DG_74_3]|nr:MAG: hypothetical protein AMJ50_00865 [Parcubacteria bacterium DG_74_3]
MKDHLFLLSIFFVIINIIQTRLIASYNLLVRGGIMVALMEIIEAPLIIYLLLRGGVDIFFLVVVTEITQWLIIAHLATKS